MPVRPLAALSVLLGVLSFPAPAARAQVPAAGPAPGVFLVARPGMPDPRFYRTVILLVLHDEQGTLGLVVNRPTDVMSREALPQLPENPNRMYWGGPVAPRRVVTLVRGDPPAGQSEPVIDEVWWSADARVLEGLLAEAAGPDRLRVFLGHAGWMPDQLNRELARDDAWLMFQAEPDQVFSMEPERLWDRLAGARLLLARQR